MPGSVSREGSRGRERSLAAEELADRAYPGTTLPSSYRRAAASAFTTVSNRGAAERGVDWQLAGPSTATYPAVLNRSNADYVASGRVSAMAIAPTCTAGNCRVWVAAAGGGIWRTDNALAATPSWQFVSGGFGTNAIGSLTYDAAHNCSTPAPASRTPPVTPRRVSASTGRTTAARAGRCVPGSPAISERQLDRVGRD